MRTLMPPMITGYGSGRQLKLLGAGGEVGMLSSSRSGKDAKVGDMLAVQAGEPQQWVWEERWRMRNLGQSGEHREVPRKPGAGACRAEVLRTFTSAVFASCRVTFGL